MAPSSLVRRAAVRVLFGAAAGLVSEFGLRPGGGQWIIGRELLGPAFDGGQGCEPTGADIEGPFYITNSPHRAVLAAADEPGQRLIIRGRILGPDCRTPIRRALLDVWQADVNGSYHDARQAYRLRGKIESAKHGRYEFSTIVPGRYKLDSGWRPSHIHFKISQPDFTELTTQLYFKGDPYLAPNDACGDECHSDVPGRIIGLRQEKRDRMVWLGGTFDIVLKPA